MVDTGGAWGHADISMIAGAPRGFRLSAFAWEGGSSKQVIYQTPTDDHYHELSQVSGGQWTEADLTLLSGAPGGHSGPPVGYAWETGNAKQVAYMTNDGAIHELWVTPGGAWKHANLSQLANAPLGWNGFLLVSAYPWQSGRSKQVVYIAEDGHVHELFLVLTTGSAWKHADLTAITGAPP